MYTNIFASKWVQGKSSKCTFCNNNHETVVHLLYKCPIVQKLWKALIRWFKYFTRIDVQLPIDVVILNDYKGPEKEMINTVILLTKHFIYAQRCLNNSLRFPELITYIAKIKTTEEYIARKNGKLAKHNFKWCYFDEHC